MDRLFARTVGGMVQAQVMQLTQQIIDQFSPDFGIPANRDQATGEIVGFARSGAAGAVESAAGGVAVSAVSSALGGLFHKAQPVPSASPSSASSTCS